MDVKSDVFNKKVRLPDFLIVGAAKAGTTSLYFYLRQHPKVFMPKIKETWFFSVCEETKKILRGNPKLVNTLDEYVSLLKKAGYNSIIGEASPIYLYLYDFTIKKIKEIYGSMFRKLKIIIILRNPIERAWSQYMMHVRDGLEDLAPIEAFRPEVIRERLKSKNYTIGHDYIGFGMYYKQVKSFLSNFKTLILFYDEFLEDPKLVLNKIFTFLEIECINVKTNEKFNISGVPKNKIAQFVFYQSPLRNMLKVCIPSSWRQRLKFYLSLRLLEKKRMPSEVKEYLSDLYEEDLKKLKNLFIEYKITNSYVNKWIQNLRA